MLDSLPKIFYSNKKLHNFAYLERFYSTSSVHLPFSIKQFGHNKSFQAFFSYNQDIALLLENILSLFATFTDILHDIPPVVMRQFYLACLVDEVRSTSSIEGIHSTRRELQDVLEGNSKNHFSSIVKKYDMLISGNPPIFTSCHDVRAFYDEFAHDDAVATNPRNKLDGVLFRKKAVDVFSPSGKIIHRGIEPEQNIIQAMSDALNFLNDNSLPALIRIAAFHYLFAYIHPFYDGNGRTARFISSSYIARRLHPLIALRLAVTIKRRIKRYYSLLRDTDAEINCGDLTPFICGFLEFIADTINDVNKKLSRKVKQLERFRAWIPKYFHDYGVVDLLLQASTFYGRGLDMNEIISLTGKTRNTIKKLFCSLPVRTKTSINSRKKFYKIDWAALLRTATISAITPERILHMTEYLLMNKDNKLLLFHFSLDKFSQFSCHEIERYVDDALLPPGFSDIQSWLEKRNYAKHKQHLRKWLRLWQIDTLKGFADITHALGLNDNLWVKKADEALLWRNVNLYSNPFNDVVAKTAFSKGLAGLQLSSTSPEFTSEGSFEKCWVRQKDGSILLFKKGSYGFANSGLEPYSEFYASQLSSIVCRSFVSYDLRKFKHCLVSSCGLFTNENEGFVPAYKYLDSGKSYGLRDILSFMERYGLDDDFRDMIVLDALILNTDRHLGNFGFIVDNDTFKVKRFAPVFDHNMALLARAMDCSIDEDYSYTLGIGHKIGADFIIAAKYMLTNRARDILRSLAGFSFYRHKSYNLPKKRLGFLERIVREQVRNILTR